MGNLDRNKKDLLTIVAKSAFGTIPCIGPFLSEMVGAIIPNQRIDRISKYVEILNERISEISEKTFERLKTDENFVDLIEEGFVQASRAITQERRNYIASILVNGITNDSLELQESKYLLKLLQELNDIEVIWLRYYKTSTTVDYKEFEEKHKNVLSPIRIRIDTYDRETMQKAALQESYKKHLERLGLIKNHIKIDITTRTAEIDKYTGQPKVSHTVTSELGEMLLEQIGLFKETDMHS